MYISDDSLTAAILFLSMLIRN